MNLTKEMAVKTARMILNLNPVFLDTETTGFAPDAEVIELTCMEWNGTVLFDQLIKPVKPIPPDVTAIHHITDEMVSDKLSMERQWFGIREMLTGRLVVAYNADFDLRMLVQSAQIAKQKYYSLPLLGHFCAMQLYSQFSGQKKWQKLGEAASQCGLKVDDELHRAKADTDLTRRLVYYMAASNN